MDGDVKVVESLSGGSLVATMATAALQGNPPELLFQGFVGNCGPRVAWNPNQANGPNHRCSGRFASALYQGPVGVQRPGRCAAGVSALQKRVDLLLELFDRGLTLDLLTVDEEGRGRI